MARRRYWLSGLLCAGLVSGSAIWMHAQDNQTATPNFHVVVDMVQLNVAVTDNKGNYVTGLKPSDFVITEDTVRQKIATFAEGSQAPKAVDDFAKSESAPKEVEPNPTLEEAAQQAGSTDPLGGTGGLTGRRVLMVSCLLSLGGGVSCALRQSRACLAPAPLACRRC